MHQDIEKELAEARAKLHDENGSPTPKYQAYLKYQSEYEEKVSKKNTAYQEAQSSPMKLRTWPITGKQYSDSITNAMNKWIALGFKSEMETALSLLKSQSPNI